MTEWTWAKVEAAAAATAGWKRTRRGEWRGPCRCGGEVNRAWVRRGRRANVLAGWRYRLEVPEPPGDTKSYVVPREKVAHFFWSENPREPWRGIGPLESGAASKLGTIAGRVEGKLAEDLACPTAYLIPMPVDGGDPRLEALRSDIAGAKGAALLLEGTSAGYEETQNQAGTRHD